MKKSKQIIVTTLVNRIIFERIVGVKDQVYGELRKEVERIAAVNSTVLDWTTERIEVSEPLGEYNRQLKVTIIVDERNTVRPKALEQE
jgi:hypothetical protein